MAAPSPVPALPDTERRTQYSITASIGPLDVAFAVYGDGTDVGNWIEVYVNDVFTQNYTITSPSGAISTIARPITDAQITFLTAQTGTVEIVGARRPRRLVQFTENQGVAARDLNQAFTDVIAVQREDWDLRSRLIRGVPGDSFPVLSPVTRQSTALGFDANGALTLLPLGSSVAATAGAIFNTRGLAQLATIAAGTQFVQTIGYTVAGDFGGATYIKTGGTTPGGFQSADGQWWQLVGGVVTPQMFGAVANSPASDGANLTAFNTAISYLSTIPTGGVIEITPNDFYVNNEIVVPQNISIVGQGSRSSIRTTSATAHVLRITGQSVIIDGLIIATNGVAKSAGAAVRLDATAGIVWLNRLLITGTGVGVGGLFNGIDVDSATRWHMTDCHIINTTNVGILIGGGADIYFIRGCSVEWQGVHGAGGAAGIEITGTAGDCLISDCQFVSTVYGIFLTETTTSQSEGRFTNCLCDHNTIGLNIFANGAGTAIGRVSFNGCDFSAAILAGVQSSTTGGGLVRGLSFNQCKFIFTSAGDGLQIADSGVRDITCMNCLFAGNTGAGARIFAGVTDFTFIGNRMGAYDFLAGNADAGLRIDVGAGDHYIVVHNQMVGNGSAFIDGGAGVNKIVTPNLTV